MADAYARAVLSNLVASGLVVDDELADIRDALEA